MKYCNICLYPETKPDIWFDKRGKCSACLAYEERDSKNWGDLEHKFKEIVSSHKSHPVYDCIVPVSGGKDSTYQIIQMKLLGYKPLAVCASTDDLSFIGRNNLDNIANLCDLIEVTTNKEVRKRIAKHSLLNVGDISWAEHVTIFTIPFKIADQMGIDLIVYGENPQNEYGAGPKGTEETFYMSKDWLQEFGGLNGQRIDDLIESSIATRSDLFQYQFEHSPKVHAIFMGQFFPWYGKNNAAIARQYGFRIFHSIVEGTGVDYENLDNHQTGIHDYFKYLKFGFGRATDIISNLLRRKECDRNYAKSFVLHYDGQYGNPKKYLGKYFNDTLKDIGVTPQEFNQAVLTFANHDLFYISSEHTIVPKFIEDLKNA